MVFVKVLSMIDEKVQSIRPYLILPCTIRGSQTLLNTVQPPVRDHPKCQDLVVAYWRWSLTRVEPVGFPSRNRSDTATYSNIVYCIHFPSYNTNSASWVTKSSPLYSDHRSTYSEHGDRIMCQVVAYKRLKTMKNYNTVTLKSGRGRS